MEMPTVSTPMAFTRRMKAKYRADRFLHTQSWGLGAWDENIGEKVSGMRENTLSGRKITKNNIARLA